MKNVYNVPNAENNEGVSNWKTRVYDYKLLTLLNKMTNKVLTNC